ncbi:phosphotransferase [Dyadobacter sp. CY327]|uniref:phosphotransferase enzyme family protein n=1 Tax=Dyadobacter sp. CY327 TaxID=2907301 RepID=UPI001F290D1F|nr:phosphotransferase [Dyadobacter sp. CY327]MCE7071652.1 phosphotransferase [Dyadobacter sp. CY327]
MQTDQQVSQKMIFPASYSTLCPSALGEFVAESYRLDNVDCSLLVRGVGDTYLINSHQGRFILRLYRSSHRSFSNVQAEVGLLFTLKHAAVPVSYPIIDRHGEAIQTINAIEGERCAVLFSYAPGQVERTLNERQLYIFGQQMARFHKVSSALTLTGDRWTFDNNTTLFDPLDKLKAAFENDQESYTWLQNAARRVASHLASIDTSKFTTGYCHFDFLPKNMHFVGDSITFFDFDFMGRGWLMYDIASFWQHMAIEVYAGRMTQQAFDNNYTIFLSGYQLHRAISEQELAAVPYLSLGFWLFYMGFHTTHDQFYSFIHPAQLKVYVAFLKHLETKFWF